MPTSFDLSFSTGNVIQASHVSQFASPVNNLESGAAVYAADSASTDAYSVTPTPGAPNPLVAGYRLHFKANTANTGVATLNVGTGAVSLKKSGTRDLETGDILAGQVVTVVYDGANFQVQGPVNLPLTTKGDLLVRDANGLLRLPVGTNGQVLTADSAQAAGLKWAAAGGGTASGKITSLWNLCPATAQTLNSTTFADVTSATGSLTALGGKPLLFHVGVTFEATANQSTRKGYFRLSLSTGTTTYLPSSTGFPFVTPYNLLEVGSQGHTFYLASLPAGTYTVKLQARINTSGESAQITANCNLTCSALELG